MPEPIPPERDVFIRPGGRFFLTSDLSNERRKDLYALCMSRGAFKESEIGTIALQLLTQLKSLHSRGIILFFLSPQSILVTRGLDNKEDTIEVQIANIVPMMMANMKNPGTFNFVSGIDRFFLAPELNLNEVG